MDVEERLRRDYARVDVPEEPMLATADEVEAMIERDPEPFAEDRPPIDVPPPTGTPQAPTAAEALAAARVDLVGRIAAGIPPREFVPGGGDWLLVGKRYLLVAKAGSGKSLVALVVAVDVVGAGGTVAIVDVENGEDEYARRLDDVLRARGDEGLEDACRDRLRYYAYPRLSGSWGEDEWAAAFEGVDLVVFDSSRLILSAHGLAEDSNDDYASFADSRLVPLSQAGTATLVLDNTGHDQDRARGAKAKDDLNEVVYLVKVAERFGRDVSGAVRLARHRDRFDLPRALKVPLGGGTYGPVAVDDTATDVEREDFRPTTLMERITEALELDPGLSVTKLREAVPGNTRAKDHALRLLVAEGYVRVEKQGQAKRHFAERLYRASEDPKVDADA
jgi:hypothetical protein